MTRALDEQAGVLVLRAWVETGQGLGNVTIFTNAGTCLPEESGSRPGPRGRVAPGPDAVIEQNADESRRCQGPDWSPARAGLLADQGLWLLAPSRTVKGPGPRLPRRLTQARRRIETVIGQLVECYHAKRVWARDAWHLWSRWQRELLSHTIAVYLLQQHGLGSCGSPTSSPPNNRTPGRLIMGCLLPPGQ